MTAHTHTNRLAHETSPYLLQHAHNPVDWYPWGEEALQRAKREQRPILLSVGYSACHWCHVMERESFENEAIAERMNRFFINIKVDREERPDVDAIYMDAVQLLTGQGGWPMTVFLTPDCEPFFGGTYFPPDDRFGRPGFARVIEAVAQAWHAQPADILEQGHEIVRNLAAGGNYTSRHGDLAPRILDAAYDKLRSSYDSHYGGFGSAPKFPQPANLEFLLRCHKRTGKSEPLEMVERTLQRMAVGGIYDQLGGGFHRYSTDQIWLVPHFEKMLYDNAQLAVAYAHAYQVTGRTFYRTIAVETLDYVLREMTDGEGGFYSAQDADSEGEEGKFFVWSEEEIKEVLGERAGAVFCAFFDVSKRGNWEGKNILHAVNEVQAVSREFGMLEDEVARILESARAELLDIREQRIHPGLDDKVLTSWNGLMLAALAECAAIFDRGDYAAAAIANAEFVLTHLSHRDEAGHLRLLRTTRGGKARLNGYLEDYAFYADGLLRLYEATFDLRWLRAAQDLMETVVHRFVDEEGAGFYATSDDHEQLVQRPRDWDDNATPSGNSVAIDVLLRLSALTGHLAYREQAEAALQRLAAVIEAHPYSFARILGALDFYLADTKEIAIVGPASDPNTRELARTVFSRYLPNKVVAHSDGSPAAGSALPLLFNREMRGDSPTAYVCENLMCKRPVITPRDLANQLTD